MSVRSATLLILRSALWTVLLPGVIAGYVPWRVFGFRLSGPYLTLADFAGLLLFVVGATILLWCILEFARTGKGTLSPFDPPRNLVVTGLYRWVRNPMYVGVALVLIGEILITGSPDLALYGALFFLCVNIFVMAFEEPYLRRTFGSSYEQYIQHVRRWIPRITPWKPLVVIAMTLFGASAAAGQSTRGPFVGGGAGGTYYCLVSRCNTGSTIGLTAGYNFTPVLSAEVGIARHFCFDCDRFTVAQAALLLQLARNRVRPFIGGGVARSSDPEFIDEHVGLLGTGGIWIGLNRRWDGRVAVRGWQVGSGDAMGELALAVVYRVSNANR